MTPIEKNIIVVDELGNRYEDTYIKRARGLVKHGRARFVDDHTICLACPPTNELEDKIMSENLNINTSAETVNVPEQPIANTRYTIEYCLEQMELITLQTEHLMQAMEELKSAKGEDAKAMAIGDMVVQREKTNRSLIAFYEKVYDDLKPEKLQQKITLLSKMLSDPEIDGETKKIIDPYLETALQLYAIRSN